MDDIATPTVQVLVDGAWLPAVVRLQAGGTDGARTLVHILDDADELRAGAPPHLDVVTSDRLRPTRAPQDPSGPTAGPTGGSTGPG